MRMIERKMLAAIHERRDWRLDNTEVECIHFTHGSAQIDRVNVKLHGSLIATLEPNQIEINNCGYPTATTKSRLNAILWEFADGAVIYQKNFKWRLCTKAAEVEMDKGRPYVVDAK